MADKDEKNPTKPAATSAKPGFDPKPVQVGGESLIERLLPHLKKIVIGLLVIAGILTVIFTVRYIKERGRQKETAKLARALDVAQQDVRPAGMPADPSSKAPTHATNKERAVATLAELEKQGVKPMGTFHASLLVQAGRIDDAITEYRKHTKGKSLDAVLAREGLGLALEMKADQEKDVAAQQKGREEALTAFQAMQPDEKGPRYAYALYHQGRLLARLGKPAEARVLLEKAKGLGTDKTLPNLIDERLAGLGG